MEINPIFYELNWTHFKTGVQKMTENKKRKLTLKKFKKKKKYMCKKLNINSDVYDFYVKTIIKYMGHYDPNKTYCGQGEDGDKLVPDLWYRNPGYDHDGLVSAIEHGETGFQKWRIDLWFKYAMHFVNGWKFWRYPIANIFYLAVDRLGDYKVLYNKDGSKISIDKERI